jgi:hypothetical protein
MKATDWNEAVAEWSRVFPGSVTTAEVFASLESMLGELRLGTPLNPESAHASQIVDAAYELARELGWVDVAGDGPAEGSTT